MVELIENGLPKRAERVFKCNACTAKFRATPPDYDAVHVGDGEKICFVAKCPCCGVNVYTGWEWIKGTQYEI